MMSRLSMFCRAMLSGVILLHLSALPFDAREDCVLRVGWDEWSPYITRVDGEFRGLEYALLSATAEAAGCTLDMRHIPWARALKMLGLGELDLLYGAGYSDERAEFAKFTLPYRMEHFVLVTGEGGLHGSPSIVLRDWLQAGASSDKPRTLGVFRGYTYGEAIDRTLEDSMTHAAIDKFNSNDQMSRLLEAGRLDGYIVESGVARMQLAETDMAARAYSIAEQDGDPLHYMFSMETPDAIVERFNDVIRKKGKWWSRGESNP